MAMSGLVSVKAPSILCAPYCWDVEGQVALRPGEGLGVLGSPVHLLPALQGARDLKEAQDFYHWNKNPKCPWNPKFPGEVRACESPRTLRLTLCARPAEWSGSLNRPQGKGSPKCQYCAFPQNQKGGFHPVRSRQMQAVS